MIMLIMLAGPEAIRLVEAGVGDRIQWRGFVQDIGTAFQEMDVLLVPSLQESWCRVAAEGMAAGLPVVGTDIPGMAELFRRVPGALTFPVDRPQVGAEHLRLLLKDPSLRRSLGEAGRDAMRAFDAGAVARQLLDLYDQLLTRSVPGPTAVG